MYVAAVVMVHAVRSVSVVLVVLALLLGVRVVVVGPFSWVLASPAGVEVGFRFDVLSVLLLGFVAGVVVLVASYSIRNLAGRGGAAHFGWLLLGALASLVVMLLGASLPVVALGWTSSGLALAALVSHAHTTAARRAGGYVRRRLLLGDVAVWAAVGAGLVLLPTLNRSELPTAELPLWPTLAVAGLLVLGCLVRSALFPAQSWLVETAEAPSPVSALLHAGMVNGAGVMVCLFWALFAAAPGALLALLLLGAASVIVGALTLSFRTDVKGRLAGSTTTQMGYMAVQLGIGLPAAAVAHLIGHGCYKAWLFLRAGGAVTRARREPATVPSAGPARDLPGHAGSPQRPRRHDQVLVVAATVLAAGGALPAVVIAVGSLGPAALLPTSAALATLVVALRAAARPRTVDTAPAGFGSLSVLGGAGAAAVTVYAWALVAFESGLAPSMPLVPLWSNPIGVVLLAGTAAVAVVVAVLLRRVHADPTGRLSLRLTLSALPPWSRRLGISAKSPVAPPSTGAGSVNGYIHPDPTHNHIPTHNHNHNLNLDRSPDRRLVVPTALANAHPSAPADDPARVRHQVQVAVMGVGPAWPLREMVAANPLAGFEGFTHQDAMFLSARLHGTRGYLPLPAYQQLHLDGRISREHLLEASGQLSHERGEDPDADREHLRAERLLEDARRTVSTSDPLGGRPRTAQRLVDHIELHDHTGQERARRFVDDHAALWCARAWSRALVEPAGGPWGLWRSAAADPAHDRWVGMPGLRDVVQSLPADPYAALAQLLHRAGLEESSHAAYLSALLSAAPGWAAHAAWRAREQADTTPLVQLLALRAALDILVAGSVDPTVFHRVIWAHADKRQEAPAAHQHPAVGLDRDGLGSAAVWQRAYELGFQNVLVARLRPQARDLARALHAAAASPAEGPDAQLVFCIDVRSERMRRAVEAAGAYETFGFAGFFGVALHYTTPEGQGFAQCPALIRPAFTVASSPPGPDRRAPGHTRAPGLAAALSAAHSSPLTALLVAEAGGAIAGAATIARTFSPARWHSLVQRWHRGHNRWGPRDLVVGLTLEQKVDTAHDVLQAIGLTSGFARLIVLCGHGATVENNAFASAYDCGACGGNSGHVNARVLAFILNDPAVRTGLLARGITIPASTTAVAAVHDTTTDEVTIDPFAGTDAQGDIHDFVKRFRDDLGRAGEAVRLERRPSLPGMPTTRSRDTGTGTKRRSLLRHFRARAGDWAQPAPEWGLAGNAAFVVGPRALTRGLDLQGRVFLHDYDPALDPDGAILTTILTAPAIVTQWINAQYYASTVDHEVFGAGDKATHNVVGDVGVLSGAHGDLRLGLPWQALFTNDPHQHPHSTQHEPLRQIVLVWARPEHIHRIVTANPSVDTLLRNEWMSLAAVDPDDGTVHRLTPQMSWREWSETETSPGRAAAARITAAPTPTTP